MRVMPAQARTGRESGARSGIEDVQNTDGPNEARV